MTDDTDIVLRLLAGKSGVTILPGTFVSGTLTTYTVDVGGGRIPAKPLGGYLPEINEPVWVLFLDGGTGQARDTYVLGPTVTKPGKGVIASVASNLATITTAYGTVVVPYPSGATPVAGDTWKITWQGGGFAIAKMSVDPAPGTAPGAPAGGTTTHVDTFTAQDAGSFQSGRWWTPEVWASDNNLGAWFYGTKIADTIPTGATIVKVEVYISPNQVYGNPPNFALHNYQTKPGGSPTLTSVTAVGISGAGFVTLPTAFGTALKSGGGSAGVGVSHGGYNKFRSLAQDGQSGALRITSIY